MVIHLTLFLTAIVLLMSCAGNPETSKTDNEKTGNKSLSLDEKALNTFKNTTMVFSGSMILAFSDAFKDESGIFDGAFDEELTDEDVAELDRQIASLNEQTLQSMDEMMKKMDAAFNDLSKENLPIYKKMFLKDIMKEGVAITEKYDLPNGFRPLSQDLTPKEIKRYIIKVTTDAEDMDDPIIKTYMELFEWFQLVDQEFNNDPEIQEFLQSIREK
jgi:hypothetical protein